MEIKDRIAKLGSIFKEMQITNVDGTQIIYVVVSFPQNWIIDNDIEEKFNVTVRNNPSVPGEYYFIAVSVILDNGREQYLGFKGLSYKVDNSSLWGKISDYMKNHVFTSIIIIIIILFMLGIMVNICRAEKRKPRPTVNIDIQGKMMEDKE